MQRTPLFVANWKMNLGLSEARKYVPEFISGIVGVGECQIALAPQAPLLGQLVELLAGTPVETASQNAGTDRSGAYTGEISPVLLRELGVGWAILGHSERRHVFGETDALVQARVRALLKEGVGVILCVGETLNERKSNETLQVVARQLGAIDVKRMHGGAEGQGGIQNFKPQTLAIAYEPVWAIGTGETATPDEAQKVHQFIRGWLAKNLGKDAADAIRIQYGGSVKSDNAAQLMSQPDIDGLLVGSASLKPSAFAELVRNAVQSVASCKQDLEGR